MQKKESKYVWGLLLTTEIIEMLKDKTLSHEQRGKIICSIVSDEKIDEKKDGVIIKSFANSLKNGYIKRNNDAENRYNRDTQSKQKYEEKRKNRDESGRIGTNRDESGRIGTNRDESGRIVPNTINKENKDKIKNRKNIPLNPPEGIDVEIPPKISTDDLLSGNGGTKNKTEEKKVDQAAIKEFAEWTADVIARRTEVWGHLLTNRAKLMKSLVSVLKKNSARDLEEVSQEILLGLNKWVETWKADDWRYAPGTLTDWIYNEKWREEPRKPKEKPKVEDCVGEVGVTIV